MDAEAIFNIINVVTSFLTVTLIPTIIALVKYVKSYKAAKTETEKLELYDKMSTLANDFISEAEKAYMSIDETLKGNNGGAVKKQNVMSKLRDFCASNGVAFDEQYWSEKIDSLVSLTKNVNVKEN